MFWTWEMYELTHLNLNGNKIKEIYKGLLALG